MHSRTLPGATIIPDGKGGVGKTQFEAGVPAFAERYLDDSPAKRHYAEQRVVTELAGSAAHDLKEPGRATDKGDEEDAYWGREMVGDLVSWEDQNAYLSRAKNKAKVLVREYWPWVEAVALALLERESLSCMDILALRPREGPP
jgi:hypothetical protein